MPEKKETKPEEKKEEKPTPKDNLIESKHLVKIGRRLFKRWKAMRSMTKIEKARIVVFLGLQWIEE